MIRLYHHRYRKHRNISDKIYDYIVILIQEKEMKAMALSNCNVTIDKSNRELIPHGIPMFPIACYNDDLNVISVPWHWHDEFEFIIMIEGTAQLHIENQSITLENGNAIFINSAILHSMEKVHDDPCRCHSLVFHARLIGGSVESVFWQKLINPIIQDTSLRYLYLDQSIQWQNEIIAYMSSAWQLIVDETIDFENETRYLLSKAFRLLNTHQQVMIPLSKQEQINAERTKIMLQFIEENYSSELTLKMIADSVSISKSACLRCFRQIINLTPIQYLIQYRIEKAAEALKNTNERVNEIAMNCGFSDISYFTKCFRELKGCTPLAYRSS